MRHSNLMLVGIAAAMILVSPASATIRITGDPGGLVIDYVERFEAARASGEAVIIDGACLSACTLAIGILPREQVCAMPNAVLGFHAAWRPVANGGRVTSPDVTQAMYEAYPANVREWIARNLGPAGRLEDAVEGAGEIGRFLGQVPGLLTRAGVLLDQVDEITRDGLVLSPETVAAIGAAEARRNRWTAGALWVIAILLAWITWMLV